MTANPGRAGSGRSARPRRSRANGEQSRERILDAATEVATERGYDGTTISLVSKNSGLPPTSIYWHFADKDDLIAAVIERSFTRWLAALDLPGGDLVRERATDIGTQVAKALLDAPDFLRLGLMLTLEHRPVEPRARAMFLQVRADGVCPVRGAGARCRSRTRCAQRAAAHHVCDRRRRRFVHRQGGRRGFGGSDRAVRPTRSSGLPVRGAAAGVRRTDVSARVAGRPRFSVTEASKALSRARFRVFYHRVRTFYPSWSPTRRAHFRCWRAVRRRGCRRRSVSPADAFEAEPEMGMS